MAERQIKDKIKRRVRIVASVSRHVQFLNEFNPDVHAGEVQSRLDKMDAKFDEFEEVQDEIATLDTEGKFEEDCSKAYVEFEKIYYALRAALLAKLPAQTSGHELDNTMARNTSALGVHSGVRLPQISLPEFNGDYKAWLSFKSTYVSLIHESGELNEVQKFHYLKSALKGEAEKLIESLTLTSENYVIAWETISKRYSNEYLLKKRHMQALMEYPRLENESASAIHALVDEFEQKLKILKQLGEKTDHWGGMIVHWMCSKLDMQTLQLWEDHAASNKDPTFAILVEFLEKRTRVLEAVSSNTVESRNSLQKVEVKRQKVIVHAATENERSLPFCCCCGEQHFLSRCEQFTAMNFKEKLQFVNNKRLCSNCLRSGHYVRDCISKFACRDCGKKHNTSIHPGFSPTNSSDESNYQSAEDSNQKADGKALSTNRTKNKVGSEQDRQDEHEAVGSYNVGIKSGNISNVFLSTVVLAIRDQNGGKHLARALLDNGSQVSIMSERLCQRLSLKRRTVNIPISGVGQAETQARCLVNTKISSSIKDFSIGVDFLVLHKVTSKLPTSTVSVEHWKIPSDIQLADPEFNTSNRIDLLIGAEHFYRFLFERDLKRISLGPGLPALINTVFGWIVTGKASGAHSKPVRCNVASVPSKLKLEISLQKFRKIESNEVQLVRHNNGRHGEEQFVNPVSCYQEIPSQRAMVVQRVSWKCRPPRAPNFGTHTRNPTSFLRTF